MEFSIFSFMALGFIVLFAICLSEINFFIKIGAVVIYITGFVCGSNYIDAHRPKVDYSGYSTHAVDAEKLPDELKECKFYTVQTREGLQYDMIYCPSKDIREVKYPVGKYTKTVILATDPLTNEDQPVKITGTITQMNCKDKHCSIELDKE